MLKKVSDFSEVKAASKALAAAQQKVAAAVEAQKRLEFRCGVLPGIENYRSAEDKQEILTGRDGIYDLQQAANQASGAVKQAEKAAAAAIVEGERSDYDDIINRMQDAALALKSAFMAEEKFLAELSGRGVSESAHGFQKYGLRTAGNFRTGLDNFISDLNRTKT